MTFSEGQRLRLPGENKYVVIEMAQQAPGGHWKLVVEDNGSPRIVRLTVHEAKNLSVLAEDGAAEANKVLAGFWSEWMRRASQSAKATALASSPLNPYPHQNRAVYGAMLPQPLLRFLLADEPGTGKTIMGGLWLREAQRLGFISRFLIVVPAHLVTKWQADFARFLGGGLRRIEAETVRQGALATPHDAWIVSLELAAMNQSVYEAINPDRAGWDAVIFDEAHRLTPTATAYHRVGRMLALRTPRAVLMTATPHRGNEWLFRSLMHLVDPAIYPAVDRIDRNPPAQNLKPGPLHFLRRMKEELVNYDGVTKLFLPREARNVAVPLNAHERAYYNEALDLVDAFFPSEANALAKMVYGKRAASSLYALCETLKRRRDQMGISNPSDAADDVDPHYEDDAERDLARVTAEASRAAREERRAIERVLVRLEPLTVDPSMEISKWPRLVTECLDSNDIKPHSTNQAVIFTEFADTADWLVGKLQSAGFSAKRYSGQDPHRIRDEIRAEFASGGFQIIVSTDAGNEGIDLQTASVLINWDIPWSLVRLEQRMGRIHRVGQPAKVWLYNLIATDTREGQAHARLLDNLIEAANELDGKMFDSLSLVGEIALAEATVSSLENLLRQTYQSNAANPAVDAIRSITKERLRQIHREQRQFDDQLSSGIDMQAALAALQDDKLERINPHVVERFLARLRSAGTIQLKQSAIAEEGLWYVEDGALPNSTWINDSDLDSSSVLVATSGSAKQRAVREGSPRAVGAITLGPSDPSFRALSDAASLQLRPELYRGGLLTDPTTVTSYELHAYEASVAEGINRRSTTWLFLIRVDATGARRVPWEILNNLETTNGSAGPAHPASVTNAEYAARRAAEADAETHAAAMQSWLVGARSQLRRLPNDLTDDIPDATDRRAARERVSASVAAKIRELEGAIQLELDEVRRVGWARVKGAAVQIQAEAGDSESIAMRQTVKLLSQQGYSVADVSKERVGYDLHARKGADQRCVEVKGIWTTAASTGVVLTGHEIAKAGLLACDYWMYVVDQCQHGGQLYAAYQDPATVFAGATRDVPVLRIPGSELKAAKQGQQQ